MPRIVYCCYVIIFINGKLGFHNKFTRSDMRNKFLKLSILVWGLFKYIVLDTTVLENNQKTL